MTLIQVWGCLLIFILCPLLGGLPATPWLLRFTPRRSTLAITMGVEASKGIACVFLARYYFPADSTWWLIALIALIFGQFWIQHSKQLWGVVAGCWVYSWQVSFLMLLLGGIGLTLLRERRLGRLGLLVLFPILVGLHGQQQAPMLAAIGLSSLVAWGEDQIPDPSPTSTDPGGAIISQSPPQDAHLFGFFRRDRNLHTLDQPLNAEQFGPLAATLSQIKHWGYHVPPSWGLPPGDDQAPLIQYLNPSPETPLVVRPDIIGGSSPHTHSIPEPVYHITSRTALAQVIAAYRNAYCASPALQEAPDQGLAVLVQVQIKGQYSGLAWSQDPHTHTPNTVVITGGPGPTLIEALMAPQTTRIQQPIASSQILSSPQTLPLPLIDKISQVMRTLEVQYQGIPQKIEWSDDGHHLWILAVEAIQKTT